MLGSDVFTAGLDTVIDALQRRVVSGGDFKASAADLEKLCAAAPPVHSARAVAAGLEPVPGRASSPGRAPEAKVPKHRLFVFPQITPAGGEGGGEDKLMALRQAVLPCTLCVHLAATRRHVVFGEGAVHAELMFVSEAPGIEEDQEGRPFAGDAGGLLDKMLLAMGLSREQVYLTSVLKCRPDTPAGEEGSRAPTVSELAQCAPYLASQISIIKPKVIVAMGAGAMKALFGSSETVGKLRSRWHDLQGIPVMPTFHPSYLMRNQSNAEKRKVWEDLLQVLEKLGLDVSEKQRGFFKPRAGA